MSVFLKTAPPPLAFSADQIVAGFHCSNFLEKSGAKAVNELSILKPLVIGTSINLKYGSTSITMVASTSPNDSGNEFLKDISDAVSFLPYLQANYYLSRDFDLKVENNKVIFTAKAKKLGYNFVQVYSSLFSLVNKIPAALQVPKPKYNILFRLYLENVEHTGFDFIYEHKLPLINLNGLAGSTEVSIGDKLNSQILNDLRAEFSDIPEQDPMPCQVTCRKYYFEYAESYGEIEKVQKLYKSQNFTVVHGGLSYIAQFNNSLKNLIAPGLPETDRFLKQGNNEIYTRTNQPQYLYFLNTREDLPDANLKGKFYFKEPGAEPVVMALFNIDLNSMRKYAFDVRFDRLIKEGSFPNQTITRYEIWIEGSNGDKRSEIRTYWIDYSYRQFIRYFLNWSSFGSIDTRVCFGKSNSEFELFQKQASKILKLGYDVKQGNATSYDLKIKNSYKVATGFISRRELLFNRDFFLSAFKWRYTKGLMLPIKIDSKTIPEITDGENLFAQLFDYSYQFEDHAYTEGDEEDSGAMFGDFFFTTSPLNNPTTGFSETDPTVPSWVKAITIQDIESWGNVQYVDEAGHSATSDYSLEAGHTKLADEAKNSSKWNGHQFHDYLDQSVRKTDDVTFLSVTAESVGSKGYVSGFSGVGYKINQDGSAEFENVTIRKELNLTTLNVREITGTGGSLAITNVAKIKGVTTNSAEWRCTIDTDDNTIVMQFRVNDIVRCQVWDGKRLKYYSARVKAVSTGYFDLDKNGKVGTGIPAPGDSVFQFGNTIDIARQGLIYMTNSDTGAPYLDVLDGITSDNLAGKTKVRLGKLTGINDSDLGQLEGYGLYAERAYIKGKIIVTGGNAATNIQVDEAKAAALAAQISANNAATAASNAQSRADAANALLTDIANDNKLTSGEKKDVLREWLVIKDEYPIITNQVIQYALDRTGYTNSYNALNTYITPLLADLITTSNIVGNTFRVNFNTYYKLRTELLKLISDKAKVLADTAQTAANTAIANAAAAKGAADAARSEADKANVLIADIANDDLLTVSEKQDLLKEWQQIQGEVVVIQNQASTYGIGHTDYTIKYNPLRDYLAPLLSSMTTNSTIVGATLRATFKAYYDAKVTLLKLVSDKAKQLADAAQSTANGADGKAIAAQTAANNAKIEADKANASIADIANDDLLTVAEKQDVLKEWQQIQGEQPIIVAQATTYAVSSTGYTANFNSLQTYLTPLLTTPNVNSVIVGTTFRAAFKSYYDTKVTLLKVVSDKAKAIADASQATANGADAKAIAAQTAANNAKFEADKANEAIADISNDDLLTAAEKQDVLKEWQQLQGEITPIQGQANAYTVSHTDYSNKYGILRDYLAPFLANMTVNSTISGTQFRGTFKAYYDAKVLLLKAISDKAKQLADAAQTAANGADSKAIAAQTAANNAKAIADQAKIDAENAKTRLDVLSNDGILDKAEKQVALKEWKQAQEEYTTVLAQSVAVGVPASTMTNSFVALQTYLTPLFANMTIDSPIIRDDFNLKFTDFYKQKQYVLGLISESTQRYATGQKYSAGMMMARDPEFINGNSNGFAVYNNGTAGVVTADLLKAANFDGNLPNKSGNAWKIRTAAGNAAPGRGGITWGHPSKRSGVWTYRIVAMISAGYSINYAANQFGDGATHEWNTSQMGTGKWEEYICTAYAGTTGTFSSIGYFYINGGNATTPMEWYIASATYYDMRAAEVDYKKLADDAQATANTAKTQADATKAAIDIITNDGILDVSEKPTILKEWRQVEAEYDSIKAQADNYGINKDAYVAAYNVVNSYLYPFFINMGANSPVDRTYFIGVFSAYYGRRQDLLSAVATAAKNTNKVVEGGVTTVSNAKQWEASGEQKGYVVIDTMIPFTNSMYSIKITGYSYEVNNANIDVTVGFYAYSIVGQSFVNTSAVSRGDYKIDQVYLSRRTGGYVTILLRRATAPTFQYPKIVIESITVGHTPPSATFDKNWNIFISEAWQGGVTHTETQIVGLTAMESTAGAAGKAEQARLAALSGAATDAKSKADQAKADAITAANVYANTQVGSAEQRSSADALQKANAARDAAVAASNTQHQALVTRLKSTAFDAIETWAIAGKTFINGGMINTNLLNATVIKSDIINAQYITGQIVNATYIRTIELNADRITTGKLSAERIDVDSLTVNNLKTAVSGTRVEITKANNGINFYIESGLVPAVTLKAEVSLGSGITAVSTYGLSIGSNSYVTGAGLFSNGSSIPFLSVTTGLKTNASVAGILDYRNDQSIGISAAGAFLDGTRIDTPGASTTYALWAAGNMLLRKSDKQTDGHLIVADGNITVQTGFIQTEKYVWSRGLCTSWISTGGSNYTATENDYYIFHSGSMSNRSVTLPGDNQGRTYIVHNGSSIQINIFSGWKFIEGSNSAVNGFVLMGGRVAMFTFNQQNGFWYVAKFSS